MFRSNQTFQESPDGIIQRFTTSQAFFLETLIVVEDGKLRIDFSVLDEYTLEFATPPPLGSSLSWSGEVGGEKTLQDALEDLSERIHDDETKLSDSSLMACLSDAAFEYSKNFPMKGIVFGHGSCIDFPMTWIEGFSMVSEVVTLEETTLISVDLDLNIQRSLSGKVFEIVDADDVAVYGIVFTRPQTIESITAYRGELLDLAASKALKKMAAAYIQEREESLGAIDLPRLPKPLEYQRLAGEFFKSWSSFMSSQVGGCLQSWQRESDLLFH